MLADCIIVMAKQPAPGLAKTRLAAAIGAQAAAALAAAFVEDSFALARQLHFATPLIAFTPAAAREGFARLLSPAALLVPQPEGDLGVRLEAAFRAAFTKGARRAVVIATDSPSLPPAILEQAFRALHRRSIVLGPALDGGYYLLGTSRHLPRLFERIDWSTDRVCGQTLARARELRLRPALLPPWYDVDGAEGLERLQLDLRDGTACCPRTAAILAGTEMAARTPRIAVGSGA